MLGNRGARSRLAASVPLATPYGFDYDLQCLAVAMAFFVRDALDRGWMRYDREVLAAAWITPLFATAVAVGTSLHLAYPVCLAFFVTCARRAWAGSESLERGYKKSRSIATSGSSAGGIG